MSRKSKGIVIAGLFVAVAALAFVWNMTRQVTVDISPYHEGSAIRMSRVTAVSTRPKWEEIKVGPNRLVKGTYLFELAYGGQKKTGIIAVEDESQIVLK